MSNSHFIAFNYNGQVIQRRQSDGYINLTQMCQANGKRLSDWVQLKATNAYIEALSEDMKIPISSLLELQHGNQTWGHPSWGHPLIAINLSRWLSPKFAVWCDAHIFWCDAHIFNLMETGQTSLDIDPIEEMKLKIELAKYEAQKSVIAIYNHPDLPQTCTAKNLGIPSD